MTVDRPRPDAARHRRASPRNRRDSSAEACSWPTRTARSSRTSRSRSPPAQITVIVGPNACGKSTLLRALGPPAAPRRTARSCSTVRRSAACRPARWPSGWGPAPAADLARRHHGHRPRVPRPPPPPAVVPPVVEGGRGRRLARPCRPPRSTTSPTARSTSCRAVSANGSGSRMALAQGTDLLLLDEPTTFLDLTHQIDVLDLLTDLNREQRPHGRLRAPRPEPGLPLRPPPRRDEARRDRRRGRRRPRSSTQSWSARCSSWTPGSSTIRCRTPR